MGTLYQAFFQQMYGMGVDLGALTISYVGIASGSVAGGNPPYTLNDFLAMYPKFFGSATAVPGVAITAGSTQVTGVASTTGFATGQLVTGAGIPDGTLIQAVGVGTLNLSQAASMTSGPTSISVYQSPFVPLLVLQVYLNLALGSLMIGRWFDLWPMAIALYVAHYATLWLQTESGPNSTAAQVANSGLQQGIVTSQSAGDVSASLKPVEGFDAWGSMNLTQYGIQLATLAQTIGSGPIYVGSAPGSICGYGY